MEIKDEREKQLKELFEKMHSLEKSQGEGGEEEEEEEEEEEGAEHVADEEGLIEHYIDEMVVNLQYEMSRVERRYEALGRKAVEVNIDDYF